MPKDINGNDVANGDKISISGTVASVSPGDYGRNLAIQLDDGDYISANSAQCVLTQLTPAQAAPVAPAENTSK